ncbi:glycosyltransferase [Pseudomonas fragi]|uniref:Group 1 glycosyl transferase n=1 Tax=Pseudomonas fragi TaxID=296 RepID=A0A449IKZ3_PSEFR|nr:glycosyltransferase [Pseudomonas fragi]VFB20065.1 group 1 glycosyl transferase [Pseudomonas fragi]
MLNILFLSHTFWGSEFRVGSHHLSKNMAEAGHNVIYIPMPVTPFHLLKLKFSDLRIKQSGKLTDIQIGLSQFIPRTFIPAGEFIKSSGYDIAFSGLSKKLKSIMERKNIKKFDYIFLDHPKLFGITRLIPYSKLIYRPTDIYAGVGIRGITKCEQICLEHSKGLITTSKPVLEHLKTKFDTKIPHLTLINGVDLELFTMETSVPEDLISIPGKKCIYVGAFDERFDFEGMSEIIKKNRNLSFIFVGPFPQNKKSYFDKLSNAHVLGTKDFSQIPAYMQACDISIMPFSDAPSNEGRSPMKLYEYLAAGLPVVSRHTDEIHRRNHSRIFTYRTISEANDKITEALKLKKESSAPKELSWKKITLDALDFAQNLA